MTERPPPGQPPPGHGSDPPAHDPPGPYPPGPNQPWAYPPPYQPKPRHPQAVLVVVLGCIAVLGLPFTGGLSGLVGPFAWVIGGRAKREIAAEPGRWADEDLVTLGYVLGIVGTVLVVLALMTVAVVIVVMVGVSSAA